MAELILLKKPDESKESLKDRVERWKSDNKSRSNLEAIRGVAAHLEVELSEGLIIRYLKSLGKIKLKRLARSR